MMSSRTFEPAEGILAFSNVGADSVWTILDRRAALTPDVEQLRFHPLEGPTVSRSAAELRADALAKAAAFHGRGIRPGDRVALLARNSDDYIAILFALARLGAILVPLNWLLTPRELGFQIADSGAKAIVAEFEAHARMDEAAAAVGWNGYRFMIGAAREGWMSLLDAHGAADALPPPPDATDVFEILYTSGTTNLPKGVLISHGSFVASGITLAQEWALRPDDIIATALPLFHVNAQMMSLAPSLTVGATLVLRQKFSASSWIDELRESRATISPMVGTQVRIIMTTAAQPSDRDNSLRVLPFGANVPEDMWSAFEDRFAAKLTNVFGMSECAGVATATPLYGERRVPRHGRAVGGRRVAIKTPDGREVVNELGEICIQGVPGETLMLGYHDRPEATAETLREGGWLHSGDIGIVDEDGYLLFVDRSKEVVKRKGENVSASEVEEILAAHPKIAEAAIIGRPDPIQDEEVVAFLVLAQGAVTDAEEMDAHCRASLAKFKIPGEYVFVDSMPRTSIGKVEKRALQALLGSVSVHPAPRSAARS